MKLRLNTRGFTLMEVMVAVLILLIVVVGLLATLIQCLFLNEANHNLAAATNDAQHVLEQVKALGYSDISSYTPPATIDIYNITYTCSYTYSITEVRVNVTWSERQRPRSLELSTRIPRTR